MESNKFWEEQSLSLTTADSSTKYEFCHDLKFRNSISFKHWKLTNLRRNYALRKNRKSFSHTGAMLIGNMCAKNKIDWMFPVDCSYGNKWTVSQIYKKCVYPIETSETVLKMLNDFFFSISVFPTILVFIRQPPVQC